MTGQTTQYLPPEWSPQAGVLLTWPHAHSDWRGLIEHVEPTFLHLARAITRRESLIVSCWDEAHQGHVRRRLANAGCHMEAVHLYRAASNDVWVRDHGPITVLRNGVPRLLDFRFNGWGHKYPAALDDQVTRRLKAGGAFGAIERTKINLVLEGGSIEVDGAGTLLTTERCHLHGRRNPGMDRAALEDVFREHFGTPRTLWLRHGALAGDDTDGHIDILARFCSPETIAYTQCPDERDSDFAELDAMEAELAALQTQATTPYELVPLPLPRGKRNARGRALPASYANFLIINGAVLVPVYDDPADTIALDRIGGCFPDREIVPIPALPLVEQAGSIHCATMQLPAGVLSPWCNEPKRARAPAAG